jgi:hypothetical protein
VRFASRLNVGTCCEVSKATSDFLKSLRSLETGKTSTLQTFFFLYGILSYLDCLAEYSDASCRQTLERFRLQGNPRMESQTWTIPAR